MTKTGLALFLAGLALIFAGCSVWIWRVYFQKATLGSNEAEGEGLGFKISVKNDALVIMLLGVGLIYFSFKIPVPPPISSEQQASHADFKPPSQTPSIVPHPSAMRSNIYFLQFGSFGSSANAYNMRNDLNQVLTGCNLGSVTLVTSQDYPGFKDGMHVVVLGPYSSLDEADAQVRSISACAGAKLKSSPAVRSIPKN